MCSVYLTKVKFLVLLNNEILKKSSCTFQGTKDRTKGLWRYCGARVRSGNLGYESAKEKRPKHRVIFVADHIYNICCSCLVILH